MYRYTDGMQKANAETILEDLKCHNGTIDYELVKKQVLGMQMSTGDFRKGFARNIDILMAKATMETVEGSAPCLPLPSRNGTEIEIGDLLQGSRAYGTRKLDVIDMVHSCSIGASGTGKSTLNWVIIEQLVEKGCTVLVFDRKRDMRYLVNRIPLIPVDANELARSLFEQPSEKVPQRSWMAKACDLFTLLGIFFAGSTYIKEFATSILDETGEPPTLYALYTSMKNRMERRLTRGNYQDSAINKIERIVEELGQCFAFKKSISILELLRASLVVETDNLSMQAERFLIGYFLQALVEARRAEGIRGNPGLDKDSIFIFFDEAAMHFNPNLDYSERSQDLSLDIFQEIAMVARDYKICCIFSSQRPLSKNVMANTRTKFIFNIQEAEDAFYLQNSTGVDQSEFRKLGVGEVIVKTGNEEAFVIKTKRMEREMVDDERIQQIKKPFVEFLAEKGVPLTKKEESREEVNSIRLNAEGKKLLLNVVNFPSMTVTQRYEALSLKGRYAQMIKNFLVDQKVVEEVHLAVGSSKQSTFLVPTQRAIDYMRNQKEAFADYYIHVGKTSALHQLIQAMLIESFRKNDCIVKNDYQVAEKFVDIYVEKENVKTVVEVCVNPAMDLERARSALDLVDYLIVVSPDMMVLKTVEKSLSQLNSNKIRLFLASNFISAALRRLLDYNTWNIVDQLNSKNSRITSYNDVEQGENRRT